MLSIKKREGASRLAGAFSGHCINDCQTSLACLAGSIHHYGYSFHHVTVCVGVGEVMETLTRCLASIIIPSPALQRACTVSLLPPPPRPQRHLAPGRGTRHRPHWPQSQQQHGQYTQHIIDIINTAYNMIHDRHFNSCECFIQIALKSPYPANTSSTDCG